MNLIQKLEHQKARITAIVKAANDGGRDLTEAEVAEVELIKSEAGAVAASVERAKRAQSLMDQIGGLKDPDASEPTPEGISLLGDVSNRKGFLALTGRGAKKSAELAANQIVRNHGVKAFVTPGTETFATPLESQSPLELQRIPTSVLEVLKSTQRDKPVWEYLRQTAFTNNAAIVAPGDEKPTSVVTIGKESGKLEVIAHLTEPIDKYLLEDNDTLVSFISSQMLYGIARKLESEVLSGDGTTGHLRGILNTSGVQAQAAGPDKVTSLRLAATKLEVLGYSSDVFILNPLDWAAIETARSTSGSFDLGGPIDRAQRRVWGTQVVTSTGVPAGTAVALDLDAATVDRDTRGVQVEWDRSQGFATNEIVGRVEGRFGLSVYRPDAIIKITLPTGE